MTGALIEKCVNTGDLADAGGGVIGELDDPFSGRGCDGAYGTFG
ncbi:hypothetical protein [Aporhodopirellula aestuarii]|nr:hypothetical protein [Aporhodopirellula aestuarii]